MLGELLPLLREQKDLVMKRNARWIVYSLEGDNLNSTSAAFDAIWGVLGEVGQRRLSVR